jgi:hypothetical protein
VGVPEDQLIEHLRSKERFLPGTSKAARNEIRKLSATSKNNAAVGLSLGAGLIPALLILPKLIGAVIDHFTTGKYTGVETKEALITCSIAAMALILADALRKRARTAVSLMED